MEIVEPLLEEALSLIPSDLAIARRAGEIRAHHYDRASCPISLADAVLVASANNGDRIATADPDVLTVVGLENIGSVVLPAQG